MTSIDLSLFNLIHGIFNHYQFLDWLIVLFSNYLIYFLVLIFILFIFLKGGFNTKVYLSSLGIISVIVSRGILTEIIRFLYYRPRPFIELSLPLIKEHAATASLPSGHIAFLVPLGILLWYENRKLGAWFLVGTLIVGLSRVSIGFHWPMDILAGVVVGIVSFYLIRKLLPKTS